MMSISTIRPFAIVKASSENGCPPRKRRWPGAPLIRTVSVVSDAGAPRAVGAGPRQLRLAVALRRGCHVIDARALDLAHNGGRARRKVCVR